MLKKSIFLMCAIAASLSAVGGAVPAKADVLWTFDNGSGVTGTLSADGSGNLTSFNFFFGGEEYNSALGLGWGFTQDYNGFPYLGAYSIDDVDYLGMNFGYSSPNVLASTGTIPFNAFVQNEGTYQDIGNPSGFMSGTQIDAPEPMSLALLGSGIAGLLVVQRRRAASANARPIELAHMFPCASSFRMLWLIAVSHEPFA